MSVMNVKSHLLIVCSAYMLFMYVHVYVCTYVYGHNGVMWGSNVVPLVVGNCSGRSVTRYCHPYFSRGGNVLLWFSPTFYSWPPGWGTSSLLLLLTTGLGYLIPPSTPDHLAGVLFPSTPGHSAGVPHPSFYS